MKTLTLNIFDETEYGKLYANDDFSVRVFVPNDGKCVRIHADGNIYLKEDYMEEEEEAVE